jgi:hypothetical protein
VSEDLARVELYHIQEALVATDGKVIEATELLGYGNRFALGRRVKRILNRFPNLADAFPNLKTQFG